MGFPIGERSLFRIIECECQVALILQLHPCIAAFSVKYIGEYIWHTLEYIYLLCISIFFEIIVYLHPELRVIKVQIGSFFSFMFYSFNIFNALYF